jgi:hypothetical protein
MGPATKNLALPDATNSARDIRDSGILAKLNRSVSPVEWLIAKLESHGAYNRGTRHDIVRRNGESTSTRDRPTSGVIADPALQESWTITPSSDPSNPPRPILPIRQQVLGTQWSSITAQP